MQRYNVLHSSIYRAEDDVTEREFVDVRVDEVLKVTANAALILIDGYEHWLPISQIEDGNQLKRMVGQGEQILAIAKWLARDRHFDWE